MLALVLSAHAFNSPSVHVAQPVVRSSPVQMMAPELPSRRATLLSAASLLALPLAAQAKPEDYYGGCALGPLFSTRNGLALPPDFTLLAAISLASCLSFFPIARCTHLPTHVLTPLADLCADTQKEYLKTYKKNPDKGGACPPPGGPSCEEPGGNPKDPIISRPSAFDKITKPIPVIEVKKDPPPEAKKEEKKPEAAPAA